jgi:radical SAM protein with 4Fe4S-binding SPASM domain
MNLERHSTVDPELFRSPPERSKQRALFSTYVRNITLELFDYCNRQCPYCPVSLIDRRSAIRLMTDEHFAMIVDNLREIDFSGSICLNLFNEPLAHERTYTAIDELTRALPKARVWFNSNGDYLNRKVLERLQAAGLKRIVVTLHVAAGAAYDDKLQVTRISQLSARTGLSFTIERFRPDIDIRASARFRGLEVTLKSVNYLEHGVNRGGAMEQIPVSEQRTAPCDRPFHDLTIAWNGNIYPCCQFVDGLPEHAPFVVGQLGQAESLFELYCSELMSSFRRDTFGYGQKRSPCDTCADQAKCRGAEDKARRKALQPLMER